MPNGAGRIAVLHGCGVRWRNALFATPIRTGMS